MVTFGELRGGAVPGVGAVSGQSITPLRKRSREGVLYVRDSELEAALSALLTLPRAEVAERALIDDRADPKYVPSECLLYFIRQSRDATSDAGFERAIYELLVSRVLRALPRPERADGEVRLIHEEVRDAALHRFKRLLASDRHTYDEKLDMYECRFDLAVARLRSDAQKKVCRESQRFQQIASEEEGDEQRPAEEGSYDPFDPEKIDELAYRSRLNAAIDALPLDQRRVIHMLQQEIPIDSKDPDVETIVKALKCSEKTVRNRRDRAYAALRADLGDEQQQ